MADGGDGPKAQCSFGRGEIDKSTAKRLNSRLNNAHDISIGHRQGDVDVCYVSKVLLKMFLVLPGFPVIIHFKCPI